MTEEIKIEVLWNARDPSLRLLCLLSVFCFLLSAFAASAASLCVGPSATGSGNGSNWTNLLAWSATPTRGDTWYLVDGSYTGKSFSTATSGTITNFIKKATVADHGGITDGWDDTMGDGQAVFEGTINWNSSYWSFDGQTGGGPTNWMVGFGFAINHTGTRGAGLRFSANNITAKHVKLTGNAGTSDSNSDHFSWDVNDGNNIHVSYVDTTNSGRCIVFCNQTATNVLFEYFRFGNIVGFEDKHGETASIWGDPKDWTFRWGLVTDIDSTGGFMWDNHVSPTGSLWIYGVVFYDEGSLWAGHGNGVLGGWTGSGGEDCHNFKAWHNTFITVNGVNTGGNTTQCLGSNPVRNSGMSALNNLFYICTNNVDGGIWNPAYNHFINSEQVGSNQSTSTGDPFVNLTANDFRLTNSITGSATNLGWPFNIDWNGNTNNGRGALAPVVAASSGNVTRIGTLRVVGQ